MTRVDSPVPLQLGADESMTRVDSPVPLHHDPDRSWITDHDPFPDHPKGTQPNNSCCALMTIIGRPTRRLRLVTFVAFSPLLFFNFGPPSYFVSHCCARALHAVSI